MKRIIEDETKTIWY